MRCLILLYASLFVNAASLVAASNFQSLRRKQITYNFSYELHLADVNCWISRQCQGLVANYPKRLLAHRLDEIIRSTQSSLDLAIYGLRNQDWFIEALSDLKERGVSIRTTVDQLRGQLFDWQESRNFVYPDAHLLVQLLGLDRVLPDVNRNGSPRTGSIMHHKFFILDQEYVWFGSTNISDTETGAEYNANVSMFVHSPELAADFQFEFEQMFNSRLYSFYKQPAKEKYAYQFADGTVVTPYFSPQDNPIANVVIPFIEGASQSIEVGIFYLTDINVAHALIAAHQRGVQVRIINDATAANNQYSHNQYMRHHGIDVRVENWGGKMHMKTAVRDGIDSIIASVNWTNAGENKNDEHLVLIENNAPLAAQLVAYFDDLWNGLPTSLGNPFYRDPRPEGPDSINSCMDGIDNDHRPNYNPNIFGECI